MHCAANGADLPDARSAASLHLGEIDIGSGKCVSKSRSVRTPSLERGCPRRADQTNPGHGLVQRERFFPINGQTSSFYYGRVEREMDGVFTKRVPADGIEGGLCWGDDALNAFDTIEDCLSD